MVFGYIEPSLYETRLFKEREDQWIGGSIVWREGDKTTIWFSCDLRQFAVSSYSILNWWYLYMFTVFLLRICVYGIAWFCYFSLIINIFYDLFNELCKYIMYNCRLILITICWCMSCCKYDNWYHNICDICVYCMILLVSKFLLNTFKIINTVVPLVGSISG